MPFVVSAEKNCHKKLVKTVVFLFHILVHKVSFDYNKKRCGMFSVLPKVCHPLFGGLRINSIKNRGFDAKP